MLEDWQKTCDLVAEVEPYVTDTVWVGKMQRIPRKLNSHVKGFERAVAKIKADQTDDKILELVKALQGHHKVRWKDSIKDVMQDRRLLVRLRHPVLTATRRRSALHETMTPLQKLTVEQLRKLVAIREQIEALQGQIEAIASVWRS